MENRNRKSSCCGNDDLVDAAVWTECLRAAVDFLTLGMRQFNRVASYLIPVHSEGRQCSDRQRSRRFPLSFTTSA